MTRFLAPAPERAAARKAADVTFSVAIAAYQAAATVGEAVASALGQTRPPLEVIVVDDGSTDDLETALEPVRDRVLLLRRQHGGPASARNAALRRARGEFVAFLDADDRFLPTRLEALGELAALRPDLDIVATDAVFEVDGEPRGSFREVNGFPTGDQRQAILHLCFMLSPAVRRSTLLAAGGFDESLRRSEDWECWMRLILHGSRAGLVDEPLYVYRVHERSLTADHVASLRSRVDALERIRARDFQLSAAEQATLAGELRLRRREALLAEAEQALLRGDGDARRRSLALVGAAGVGLQTRIKSAAAAAVPGVARRLLSRRGGADRAQRPPPGRTA